MKVLAVISMIVGIVVVLVGTIAVLALGQAWILQHVWQWYAVGVFGMPSLKLSHCFLLMYVIGLLTHQNIPNEDTKKHPWAPMCGSVTGWLGFFLIAWWLR